MQASLMKPRFMPLLTQFFLVCPLQEPLPSFSQVMVPFHEGLSSRHQRIFYLFVGCSRLLACEEFHDEAVPSGGDACKPSMPRSQEYLLSACHRFPTYSDGVLTSGRVGFLIHTTSS
ncbi:UNVERIFIED_CONTAM: hypothetical protein Sradi_4158800 [Sesamum radiatum]|uniref:Secreted protein n=1 Tax=Sesamum radiatum TaxID=300843 RepID=A0AAW2P5P2_SESRA